MTSRKKGVTAAAQLIAGYLVTAAKRGSAATGLSLEAALASTVLAVARGATELYVLESGDAELITELGHTGLKASAAVCATPDHGVFAFSHTRAVGPLDDFALSVAKLTQCALVGRLDLPPADRPATAETKANVQQIGVDLHRAFGTAGMFTAQAAVASVPDANDDGDNVFAAIGEAWAGVGAWGLNLKSAAPK